LIKMTCLFIPLTTVIPKFKLNREDILTVLYKFAGYRDIAIDGHPDFSKRFFLLGEDPTHIQTFFTDELVLFFESNPYYRIESTGTMLLIMRKERLASVKEIKELLDYGRRLGAIIELYTPEEVIPPEVS